MCLVIVVEWKWSWKKPAYKQLLKYTPENLRRYQDYVNWIAEQDLTKLKFMDEVHFVAEGMLLCLNVDIFKDVSLKAAIGPVESFPL